jgi:hypothetical protein
MVPTHAVDRKVHTTTSLKEQCNVLTHFTTTGHVLVAPLERTYMVNMMTPRLQMSTLLSYIWRKMRTSGAEYAHVPHTVDMRVWFTRIFARPKSAICNAAHRWCAHHPM